VAEERKRGFFSRLFGVDEAPPPGDEEPAAAEREERGSPTRTMMSDGLVVPEVEPAGREAEAAEEAAGAPAEDLEQFRTESPVTPPPPAVAASEPATAKQSWWDRLRNGLSRSSQSLTSGITDVFTKRRLDQSTLDELEELLIQADLGIDTASRIVDALAEERLDKEITPDEVRAVLAVEVEKALAPVARPLEVGGGAPFVILMVGVNGTGKTTTIGKLAARLRAEGRSVMLAAGDTFRAAAIEQLKIWGERARAPVIAREPGADAAGLAFDAMVEAKKAGADVLLVDTAGRLQNKAELMAELAKVVRVIKKHDASAPHAVLLTLDATTGQNAMSQVEVFRNQAGVTGLVMTKLDGTARGGILVAIAAKHRLPVHFIGVGEGIEDLAPFSARDFARAIAGLA
jgi:fused signal recognition particle receptor